MNNSPPDLAGGGVATGVSALSEEFIWSDFDGLCCECAVLAAKPQTQPEEFENQAHI
jgi:hypothetical protein